MLNFIVGAAAIGVLWFLFDFVRKTGRKIAWWQWLLTILGVVYLAILVISAGTLVGEGAAKAALVIGGIFGLIAVIWGVLIGRFVFLRKTK